MLADPLLGFMNGLVERSVGAPVIYEELRHKPGRRVTLRARGPRGSAIVKLYHSDRVARIAATIAELAAGPCEPTVPEVLGVDPSERMLVLSDVAGIPLREAVLASNEPGCRRAGAAIAAWHSAWAGKQTVALRTHTVERELELLVDHAARARRAIGLRIEALLPEFRGGWGPATVVHRDLYEDQVLLGERVGLIDLDDAALGPPELDIGNLLAQLDLLELRSGRELSVAATALLEGYGTNGPLDPRLLERCRTLARLRLACIHDESRLLRSARVAVRAGA